VAPTGESIAICFEVWWLYENRTFHGILKNALARGTPEHRKWHPRMPRYPGSETLLQPQKPIWEILARLHHRVATDCSLSHPAGHKPFSCSHQGLHVSRDLTVDVMCWMRFSVHISARVFTTTHKFCQTQNFVTMANTKFCCHLVTMANTKFWPCVPMAGNGCRCALLNVT